MVVAAFYLTPLYGIPYYAKRYLKNCSECHTGYAKSSYRAERFKSNLYMPENYNPKMKTVAFRRGGEIYLPQDLPVSFRVRAFLGMLAREGEFRSYGDVGVNLYSSFNLSSVSSFFFSLGGSLSDSALNVFRDVLLYLKMPANSRFGMGKFSLSEFFIKRNAVLTYRGLRAYELAELEGIGAFLSLTPFLQFGLLDARNGRPFLRTGANTEHFSFALVAVPVDGFQRFGCEVRTRFGGFDLFAVSFLALDQKLGRFDLEDSTASVIGSYGLDLTFGRYYASLLYNYRGAFKGVPENHTSLLTLSLGFFPVENLKVSLEGGYEFAVAFPKRGTYVGIATDWAF